MQSTHPDVPSSYDFTRNPALLMKFFHSAQQLRDSEIYNRIRACIHLIDDKFRASPDVARYFFDILRDREAGRLLRWMHELEILDKYIPEFGAIKNLVRHEMYHQYTVDEHTLVAIENLDESTLSTMLNSGGSRQNGKRAREGDFMEMLRALQKPEFLRLAILLHDVGVGAKGPGGHEDKSLRAAKAVLERSSIPDEADEEMVLFLIANHLQMSQTAQHRDLDDEKVIQRFGKLVKDEKHLVMLYLFTFADMRAVGRGVWSDWNAALLWELYAKTSQVLKGEYEADKLQLTAIQDEVNNLIGKSVSAKSIQRHFNTMPPEQLLSSKPDEIAKHITLIEQLRNFPLVLDCQRETNNYSQIILACAHDELGFFSKMAGVLASQNINILSAQVNTREDGIVLDILNVTDGNTGESISDKKCQQVEALLKSVLVGETDIEIRLSRQEFSRDRHAAKATIAPGITINNDDSDIYTIIDVQTEDRIGLLYTISRAFYQLRLNLYLAKISTKGRRAVDVFYVQDEKGYKILNQEKLHEIKTVLEKSLGNFDE
ncbi:HD domain-containing protein [Candidatus Poribacteria bacterium]|nr:HD domain-containing protein [Candidatus Poribacteria bacterium]